MIFKAKLGCQEVHERAEEYVREMESRGYILTKQAIHLELIAETMEITVDMIKHGDRSSISSFFFLSGVIGLFVFWIAVFVWLGSQFA